MTITFYAVSAIDFNDVIDFIIFHDLVFNDRRRKVLTCDVESQPTPLLSRQSKILKVVPDFKYLGSWVNSTEKDIEVRKSLGRHLTTCRASGHPIFLEI